MRPAFLASCKESPQSSPLALTRHEQHLLNLVSGFGCRRANDTYCELVGPCIALPHSRMATHSGTRRAAAPVASTQHIHSMILLAHGAAKRNVASVASAADARCCAKAPRSGTGNLETMYDVPASGITLLNFGRRQARTASKRTATFRFPQDDVSPSRERGFAVGFCRRQASTVTTRMAPYLKPRDNVSPSRERGADAGFCRRQARTFSSRFAPYLKV
ncbi:hypothetical protein C8R47DRAFT_1214151 [Mycena vitilis]|nr:hypothetical protein C8R47DRAFT_1214151 [Mycena vitilis]